MKQLFILLINLFFAAAASAQQITDSFFVAGNCEHCQSRIQTTATANGADSANWNIDTHILTVYFQPNKTSRDILQQKIAKAGHDNEAYQTSDRTYKRLPACCHYERIVPGSALPATAGPNPNRPIMGVVLDENNKGKFIPLHGATIRSLGTGITALTDSQGVFQIATPTPAQLEISYSGFRTDTFTIPSAELLQVVLKQAGSTRLKEVIIRSRNPSAFVSSLSTLNTLSIGSRELTKAACCNLSESFETSPSVDVSYADAVTGVKQIQLLGLAGSYTQLLTENAPETRGLSGAYGLTFIPGPWLEGIQVTKGVGAVANGYESISGQINIEEKKPDKAEKILWNNYVNNMGRLETNLNLAQLINNKWSTALLLHTDASVMKNDGNQDGFLDMPLGRQLNLINRWKYQDNNGWIIQFAIKALTDHRQAGQAQFNPDTDKGTTRAYGVGIDLQQLSATAKLGYLFPQQKYKSIGLIVTATDFSNDAYYGLITYLGKQKNINANLIYQSIIGTTQHKFRTGLNVSSDQYQETLSGRYFYRTEKVAGAFFEYTYSNNGKFSAIAGYRIDHHNQFGWIQTPRIHLKYDIAPKTNLRLSWGTGFRMANIIAENPAVLVSNRQYQIRNNGSNFGYGLSPEKAWNAGFNFQHQFTHKQRNGTFSIDIYRTQFTQQTVVDLDEQPNSIWFYDLNGKSYANSFQTELNYELPAHIELRLAYRYLDVQTNYNGKLLQKPLVAKHRAFLNIGYNPNKHWKLDATVQYIGAKRLPASVSNPPIFRWATESPGFWQVNAQISWLPSTRFELYLGGENLSNYTQQDRIIDATHPFSNYFDGSITWGPVLQRMLYVGMRWRVKGG
jgi:outer membrane cobalamin receptor